MEKKTFEYKQDDTNHNTFQDVQPEPKAQPHGFYYSNLQGVSPVRTNLGFSTSIFVTALSLWLLSMFSDYVSLSGILPVFIIALFIGIFSFVITIVSIATGGITAANSQSLSLAALVAALVKIFGSAFLLVFLDFLFGNSFDIHGGLITAIWVYFMIFIIQSLLNLLFRKR